jgi:hypothetical protein
MRAAFLRNSFCFLVAASVSSTSRDARTDAPKPDDGTLRGRVVEIGPHLKEHCDVLMDDDQGHSVALVTDSGEVVPIVKDLRSRGLFMDERLRDRAMELEVHRYPKLPFVQVIEVYSLKGGKRYRVDYWCDVCAISTFQPGPCPCCQAEITLREKPVEDR